MNWLKVCCRNLKRALTPYSAPKATPVQQPVKAVEPKQAEAPKASKETPATENNPMLWWLLGGGIALLGVIVLLMRRKQS